jgi:hypothetical protein
MLNVRPQTWCTLIPRDIWKVDGGDLRQTFFERLSTLALPKYVGNALAEGAREYEPHLADKNVTLSVPVGVTSSVVKSCNASFYLKGAARLTEPAPRTFDDVFKAFPKAGPFQAIFGDVIIIALAVFGLPLDDQHSRDLLVFAVLQKISRRRGS